MTRKNRRVDNWPEELSQKIQEAQEKEFKRGEHDCLIWTADVVKALTGEDIASYFRGNYSTYKEGLELCRDYCGKGAGLKEVLDKMMDEHDFEEIDNPEFAQRGDVALVHSGQEGITCGICCQHKIYTLGPSDVLGKVKLSKAIKAWRIR